MGTEEIKNVSAVTGRYTVTTVTKKNEGTKIRNEETKFFAKDGTQIKSDYYSAAESKDLAAHNGYNKYYDTKVVQQDGKYYLEVTAKKSQKVAILAKDFMGEIDNGVLKATNPKYFAGYNAGYTPDGKPLSDSNKEMKAGEKLLIPADNLKIDSSPCGKLTRWSLEHTLIQCVK